MAAPATAMDMDRSDSRKPPSNPPTAKPSEAPRPDGRAPDGAFDVWLQRGLHQLYDSVAAEPIPAKLLRLIEADKARDKG